MKRVTILFLMFLISCGGKSSTESVKELVDVNPAVVDECKDKLQAKVIIDDLNWYDYSDAKNYDEYLNSKTVGKLSIPIKRSRCTGFIINENTIMTNHHCVSWASQAKGVTFKIRDLEQEVKTFKCDKLIMTSRMLDYTLLECREKLGLTYGQNTLSGESAGVEDSIYVIQENCDYKSNPSCRINKQIAHGNLKSVGTYTVSHDADTLGGSSGSPIYDEKTNEVVAIHNAGNSSLGRNYGIPMKKIIQDIRKRKPNLVINKKKGQTNQSDNCE